MRQKRRRVIGEGRKNSSYRQWPLAIPSLSRAPQATILPPDLSVVMKHKLMQSAAELLKNHTLLLHCGNPAVSPSSHSWGNSSGAHVWKRTVFRDLQNRQKGFNPYLPVARWSFWRCLAPRTSRCWRRCRSWSSSGRWRPCSTSWRSDSSLKSGRSFWLQGWKRDALKISSPSTCPGMSDSDSSQPMESLLRAAPNTLSNLVTVKR